MIKPFRKAQKGFTLIELLIVVAILGVLAAIAIPNLGKFVGSSKVSAASAEAGMVETAIQAGMADAGTAVVVAGTIASGTDFTIDATHFASSYIQGPLTQLTQSYGVGVDGRLTTGTLNGLPTGTAFSPATGKYIAP